MRNPLVEFYRCPDGPLTCPSRGIRGSGTQNPCGPPDFEKAIDDLRLERYANQLVTTTGAVLASEAARRLYYRARPVLPKSLRQTLQRMFLRDWDQLPFPRWPVDTGVEDMFEQQLIGAMKSSGGEDVPFIWFWPRGASSAAVMTHDVEESGGLALVPQLIDLDDEFGVKASFQLVPEQRYAVPTNVLEMIRTRQCEVNVHGLNHDGNLFRDRNAFLRQCRQINHYVREFEAEGFRSACMYRKVAWYDELNISYDMSVPNVAHLEPQRGGCCTVFPYFIGDVLELPLTTVQDYSLFHILGDYSIDLWKRQIEMIVERHGLLSFIVHPDYIFAENALRVYRELLAYLLRLRSERNVWMARPGEVNHWWRERSAMNLICEDGTWRIEGPGRERARIAVAHLEGERISYKLGHTCEPLARSQSERVGVSQGRGLLAGI